MSISHLNFELSREQRQKAESQAQAQAIANFKQKAEELAKGFGFSRYSLREVEVSASQQGGSGRPRAMAKYSMASADGSVPVEAGRTEVTVNVSGSVQLQP